MYKVKTRLVQVLTFALSVTLLSAIGPRDLQESARASLATTSCGAYAGTSGAAGDTGSGVDLGAFKVLPLHGKAFYLDLKNGMNASYIGYEITYDGASTIRNYWIELTNFRDSADAANSVLSLANPADSIQPLGDFVQNQKRVVYFLVKGSSVSSAIQRHDLRIHSAYPDGTSTIADSGNAKCRYEFTKATRVLAASANKVTSISVNTTSPTIGDSVVVTISGTPGTVGAGSSPDNSIFWLSAASSSQWPTRALRLESASLSVKISAQTHTISNRLALLEINDDAIHWVNGKQKLTNKSSYTATFTFRVLGGTATNPVVRPVANIASGTQIKHTGTYPSTQTSINTSSTRINMTSVKTISSISSDSSSGYWDVVYKVKLTDTASAVTLDSIVDDPDTSVIFSAGSAKIIDATRSDTFTAIPNPKSETTTVNNYKYTFGGPFTGRKVGSVYEIELTYTMRIPTSLAATVAEVFNRAYGLIGSTVVGASSTQISATKLTLNPSGATPTGQNGLVENKPLLPQEISFPTPSTAGVGQTYELEAVASSGLAVTYTSLTASICTISGGTVVYVGAGTCQIQASQGGNSSWLPASSVTVSVVVRQGQTITFNPTSPQALASNQTVTVSATSGLTVTVEVISTDVCALNAAKNSFTATAASITIYPIISGQCLLVASQAGDATWGPAPNVERTVAIGASQYIDFPAISDTSVVSGSSSFTVTSKKSSDNTATILPVAVVSSTPDICDLTAEPSFNATSGVTTVQYSWTKEGICIFVASQDGYNASDAVSSYAPASDVTRSFKIGNRTPTVLVTPSLYEVNSEDDFTATVTVTVPATGTLSGTVYLYTSGRISSTYSIQEASKNVSLSTGANTTHSYNLKAGILATGAPSEQIALSASFVTSNSDFTSSSTTSDTFVTVISPTLTASTQDIDTWTTTSGSFKGTFNPKSANAALTYIVVGTSSGAMDSSGVTITLPVGETGTGSVNIDVAGSKSGLSPATRYYFEVREVRDGFVAEGGIKSFVTKPAVPDTATVTFGSNSAVVTFDTVTAGTGVTIEYTVTCTPTGGGTAKSATGSTSPLTVNGLGSATEYRCAVKAHSSAAGSGGGGFGGERLSAPFTTSAPKTDRVLKIAGYTALDPETRTVTVTYGETASVYVIFEQMNGNRGPRSEVTTDLGAGSLTFTRSSGSVCTAAQVGTSETATVSFTGVGTCTFTAVVAENTTYGETSTAVAVTVVAVAKGLVATASTHTVSYGDAVPTLSATVTGFVNSENSGSAAGYVAPTCSTTYTTSTNAGTSGLTVTCSSGSATNYTFSYVSGSVTVNPAAQVVTLAALANMAVGDGNQSTSTTNDKSRSVDLLSTSDLSICDIVSSSVRAKGEGSCTVSAQSSASGDGNYNASNIATRTFTITAASGNNNNGGNSGGGNSGPAKLNPAITWNDPTDIYNPTPLGATQLNAVGSVAGALVYTPAAGTILAVGRHTLSVTLNPTDSATYNSVSTTVRIRVLEQRFQTILTWNDPASIVYPTPLSRTQLNARANTPGAFTYDPGVGTVLNPGTHILKVDFEPTLSRSYQPASTQVTIIVTTSGSSTPIVPTPQQPIVVDTRPSTTPSNPNQGGGNSGGNPGNPNNPGNNTPPGQSNPVILIDSKSVNSVTITDRGPGVTNAQVRTDRIDIVTAPTFSGKTSVEVTYVQNSETRVVVVPLVIPPAPPATAASSPQAMERSTIQWSASPNAISYDVYVRDNLECQVRTTSCEVPFIVGPATPIRVVVIGGDATKVEVAPVFKQERVIPALTVNFATASSRLNAQFREELRDIAEIIEREGFTSLIVYGHTDSRSYDNRTLSRQRAEATRDFLQRLLPNVEFKIAGFAATQRVAAENTRAGLAQNRRAEVRIAG